MESRERPGRGLSEAEIEQAIEEARAIVTEWHQRSWEGDLEATMALLQVSTVH
jgi:hypothetical protein